MNKRALIWTKMDDTKAATKTMYRKFAKININLEIMETSDKQYFVLVQNIL